MVKLTITTSNKYIPFPNNRTTRRNFSVPKQADIYDLGGFSFVGPTRHSSTGKFWEGFNVDHRLLQLANQNKHSATYYDYTWQFVDYYYIKGWTLSGYRNITHVQNALLNREQFPTDKNYYKYLVSRQRSNLKNKRISEAADAMRYLVSSALPSEAVLNSHLHYSENNFNKMMDEEKVSQGLITAESIKNKVYNSRKLVNFPMSNATGPWYIVNTFYPTNKTGFDKGNAPCMHILKRDKNFKVIKKTKITKMHGIPIVAWIGAGNLYKPDKEEFLDYEGNMISYGFNNFTPEYREECIRINGSEETQDIDDYWEGKTLYSSQADMLLKIQPINKPLILPPKCNGCFSEEWWRNNVRKKDIINAAYNIDWVRWKKGLKWIARCHNTTLKKLKISTAKVTGYESDGSNDEEESEDDNESTNESPEATNATTPADKPVPTNASGGNNTLATNDTGTITSTSGGPTSSDIQTIVDNESSQEDDDIEILTSIPPKINNSNSVNNNNNTSNNVNASNSDNINTVSPHSVDDNEISASEKELNKILSEKYDGSIPVQEYMSKFEHKKYVQMIENDFLDAAQEFRNKKWVNMRLEQTREYRHLMEQKEREEKSDTTSYSTTTLASGKTKTSSSNKDQSMSNASGNNSSNTSMSSNNITLLTGGINNTNNTNNSNNKSSSNDNNASKSSYGYIQNESYRNSFVSDNSWRNNSIYSEWIWTRDNDALIESLHKEERKYISIRNEFQLYQDWRSKKYHIYDMVQMRNHNYYIIKAVPTDNNSKYRLVTADVKNRRPTFANIDGADSDDEYVWSIDRHEEFSIGSFKSSIYKDQRWMNANCQSIVKRKYINDDANLIDIGSFLKWGSFKLCVMETCHDNTGKLLSFDAIMIDNYKIIYTHLHFDVNTMGTMYYVGDASLFDVLEYSLDTIDYSGVTLARWKVEEEDQIKDLDNKTWLVESAKDRELISLANSNDVNDVLDVPYDRIQRWTFVARPGIKTLPSAIGKNDESFDEILQDELEDGYWQGLTANDGYIFRFYIWPEGLQKEYIAAKKQAVTQVSSGKIEKFRRSNCPHLNILRKWKKLRGYNNITKLNYKFPMVRVYNSNNNNITPIDNNTLLTDTSSINTLTTSGSGNNTVTRPITNVISIDMSKQTSPLQFINDTKDKTKTKSPPTNPSLPNRVFGGVVPMPSLDNDNDNNNNNNDLDIDMKERESASIMLNAWSISNNGQIIQVDPGVITDETKGCLIVIEPKFASFTDKHWEWLSNYGYNSNDALFLDINVEFEIMRLKGLYYDGDDVTNTRYQAYLKASKKHLHSAALRTLMKQHANHGGIAYNVTNIDEITAMDVSTTMDNTTTMDISPYHETNNTNNTSSTLTTNDAFPSISSIMDNSAPTDTSTTAIVVTGSEAPTISSINTTTPGTTTSTVGTIGSSVISAPSMDINIMKEEYVAWDEAFRANIINSNGLKAAIMDKLKEMDGPGWIAIFWPVAVKHMPSMVSLHSYHDDWGLDTLVEPIWYESKVTLEMFNENGILKSAVSDVVRFVMVSLVKDLLGYAISCWWRHNNAFAPDSFDHQKLSHTFDLLISDGSYNYTKRCVKVRKQKICNRELENYDWKNQIQEECNRQKNEDIALMNIGNNKVVVLNQIRCNEWNKIHDGSATTFGYCGLEGYMFQQDYSFGVADTPLTKIMNTLIEQDPVIIDDQVLNEWEWELHSARDLLYSLKTIDIKHPLILEAKVMLDYIFNIPDVNIEAYCKRLPLIKTADFDSNKRSLKRFIIKFEEFFITWVCHRWIYNILERTMNESLGMVIETCIADFKEGKYQFGGMVNVIQRLNQMHSQQTIDLTTICKIKPPTIQISMDNNALDPGDNNNNIPLVPNVPADNVSILSPMPNLDSGNASNMSNVANVSNSSMTPAVSMVPTADKQSGANVSKSTTSCTDNNNEPNQLLASLPNIGLSSSTDSATGAPPMSSGAGTQVAVTTTSTTKIKKVTFQLNQDKVSNNDTNNNSNNGNNNDINITTRVKEDSLESVGTKASKSRFKDKDKDKKINKGAAQMESDLLIVNIEQYMQKDLKRVKSLLQLAADRNEKLFNTGHITKEIYEQVCQIIKQTDAMNNIRMMTDKYKQIQTIINGYLYSSGAITVSQPKGNGKNALETNNSKDKDNANNSTEKKDVKKKKVLKERRGGKGKQASIPQGDGGAYGYSSDISMDSGIDINSNGGSVLSPSSVDDDDWNAMRNDMNQVTSVYGNVIMDNSIINTLRTEADSKVNNDYNDEMEDIDLEVSKV